MRTFLSSLGVVILLFLFGGLFVLGWEAVTLRATPVYHAQLVAPTPVLHPQIIFQQINAYRVSHGVPALRWSSVMCPMTQQRTVDIETDFSHDKATAEYQIQDWFSSRLYYGENIAEGYPTDAQTVQAWLHSPDHLANIVKPKYTATCVGVAVIGYETYVVQEFTSL